MNSWHPEEADVVRFLRIVTDPETDARAGPLSARRRPHGDDVRPFYRIAVQGWSKEEALHEMTGGGFGFHEVWQNLLHYINAVDIERVKAKAKRR